MEEMQFEAFYWASVEKNNGIPVTTANGQTYERAMIGKWFARGNVTDPVSKRPLKSLHLSPATSLQKEISLWKSKRKKKPW